MFTVALFTTAKTGGTYFFLSFMIQLMLHFHSKAFSQLLEPD